MSFTQGAPTQDLSIVSSNVFLYGSSTAGNAFTVQQLSAGNVASFQRSTGATSLIINPSGQVGIGKTNPGYALDVTGDLNFTGTFRQNGTPYVGSQWTGTSTLFFVGNVGIGTASPQYRLHVTNPGPLSNIVVETDTNAIGQRSEIRFGIPAFSGTGKRAGITSNTYVSDGSDLQFWTNASGGTLSTPQMTILQSGFVGIGTTNPTKLLQVWGGMIIGASSDSRATTVTLNAPGATVTFSPNADIGDGARIMCLQCPDLSSTTANLVSFSLQVAPTGSFGSQRTSLDLKGFRVASQSYGGFCITSPFDTAGSYDLFYADRTKAYFQQSVGIGTNNPGTALDVNGTVTATTFSGSAASLTSFPTLNQNTTGSSGSCTGNSSTATTATNQSGGTVSATTGAFSGNVSFFGGNSGTNGFTIENITTFTRIAMRQMRWYDWGGVGDFIYLASGCVGIRTSQTSSALEVAGRSYFWGTSLAGGGQNRFTGLDADSTANGRAQVVLNSSYSDLVISSSQANGTYGSTVSFVTADPVNVASYRKFVINVGGWGGYGSGGYGDRMSFNWKDQASTNPHDYVQPDVSVMCLDGRNKRVGINNVASPGYNLDVNGTCNVSGDSRVAGQFTINNNNPTITFQDTDGMTAYWHCNSNLMYLLRGGVNAGFGSWATVGSGSWPVYWDLSNNDARFGGAIYAVYDITAFSSDERLKTKVGSIENALDKVCSLNAFKYIHNDIARKHGFTDDLVYVGLSAQEVQKVLPEVIKPAPFDVETEKGGGITRSKSGENYLTIQYERIVSLLVEAVKEERAERLKVEERLARLEKLLLKE